ncbi:MAG: XRE family transcriptional regulator, partial [Alphaproteobacteria bacterium]
RGLSVRAAEKLSGYSASDFSAIRTAKLKRFTIDRLIKIINALDDAVEVSVHIRQRQGKLAEVAAQ